MNPPLKLSVPSFAKINWVLDVLGVRRDGLHDLYTILQTITLHDDLNFDGTEDGTVHLSCDAPGIPRDETNLIHRAATAFRAMYRVRKGVRIHLVKRIPAGGGLGGGSSNSAVTLLALNYLWNIGSSVEELNELAAELGADVPFFLLGGTAVAKGSGREVVPIEERRAEHMLIVTPSATISTSLAYAKLDEALTKDKGKSTLSICRASVKSSDSRHQTLSNDFERVIFGLEPETEVVRNRLMELGARGALLAGSGSSIFAIFDNREAQERVASVLHEETEWRIFMCATLEQEGYLGALGPCAAVLRNALS